MGDIHRELWELVGKLKVLLPEIEGYKEKISEFEKDIATLKERIENIRIDVKLAHERITQYKDATGGKWWDIVKIILGSVIGALITFFFMSIG